MKKFFTFTFLTALVSLALGQVVINDADMPVPGDTLRYKTTTNVNGIDYTLTGANYTWDFSTLSSIIENADTFVTVLSTPLTYNVAFNNPLDLPHKATVASPQPAFMPIPIIQMSDVYNFYKNSPAAYSMVGFGARINSVPLPVKYDNPEVYYNFPLTVGNIDSTTSSYGVTIPSFGYYGETRKRINHVDGWGIIYLPHDTFNVIRVKSEIFIHDTIYLDTMGGISQAFNRSETEYRWLAPNHHMPVLQITKRNGMGGALTIKYFDDYIDTASYISENTYQNDLYIYPNPSNGNVYLKFNNQNSYDLFIYNSTSQIVLQINNLSVNEKLIDVSSFPKGLYLFQIRNGNNIYSKKILIQ